MGHTLLVPIYNRLINIFSKPGRRRTADLEVVCSNPVIRSIDAVIYTLEVIKYLPCSIHVNFCALEIAIHELGVRNCSKEKHTCFLLLQFGYGKGG